ncbi:MAG: PDZ domain-containing protein [Bacilli bacterium]|nr:PDZ domain-containing protein [Bacilli bacterium]
MKKKIMTILLNLSILFAPLPVWAYSNEIIIGGDNIGIHIDSDGVLVIGFYKVNGSFSKGNPEIEVGDRIVKVANTEVSSIDDLTRAIEKNLNYDKVNLTIKRGQNTQEIELPLSYVDGVYKTGLYVKDGISGIGTLTYIDPGTKIFGTLGHEIVESTSGTRIEVKQGSIFDSEVSKIIKSTDGKVGEKNAKLNYDKISGNITKNTLYGVFGKYTKETTNGKKYTVGKPDEIKLGKALIYTVLSDNKINEYEITITKINKNNEIKNITFEITDDKLLSETGGVIQGMSGSPIIQDNKIIGAVTHAIVDKVSNGYGIFITTMLEEGEKK